jgi:cell division protein ZapA
MINLQISIGNRPYQIACREGQEAHFQALAAIVNEKIATAEAALGSMSETRQLMFTSLLLADELMDRRRGDGAPPTPAIDPVALERVADRMEALAAALETGKQTH